jgi:hypothetical protein
MGRQMVARNWPPENTGAPLKTPFVYYVSGVPVFPPNNIREMALDALKPDNSESLTDRLKSRVKNGLIGGTVAILPETWWNQFLLNYVAYFGNNFSEPREMEEHATRVLEIIASSSPKEAWKELVEFTIQEIDVLSGWKKSWTRELAKRHNVFWGDDGNYYCRDLDGTLIHVVGEKALPETHLDFVSDHILRGWGCIRQALNVFSAFAISDDYAREPTGFPRSMKAVVNQTHHDTSHHWHLAQFHHTRSIKWRPFSNFCDPEWLAGDLLGRITDTLDRNQWKEAIERQAKLPNQLDEDCTRQMDYVLDSRLSVGGGEEIYFKFEGRTFRWVNGTIERKPTISVGYKDPNSHRAEDESLNRLLSILVWDHREPIVKEDGVGGPKRPIPHIWAPRLNIGHRIEPQYLPLDTSNFSRKRWLALALYKEGTNSKSVFYEFFSFWKIIEVAIKDKSARWDWINKTVSKIGVEGKRVAEITKTNSNIAEYLDYSCRSAIAHVFHQPIVNPDDYADYIRISQDVRIVEDLARRAADEYLPPARP